MQANTTADIMGAFPNPSLTPIIGLPTYAAIAEIHLLLNQNAASVDSDLGGGQHGHLALTVSAAVYATISAIPFVAPINPGPHPIQAPGATAAQIAEANRIHDATLRVWRQYQATDKALKQLLLQAVDPVYVQPLRNRLTGFATVSTRTILDHLYARYGRISPLDLEANDQRFKAAYDTAMPIEGLFEQISKAIDLADAAGAPYTPEQILNNAYALMFQTGVYGEACKEWRRRLPAQKTWPLFQEHFAAAHEVLREAQATTQSARYHQCNFHHRPKRRFPPRHHGCTGQLGCGNSGRPQHYCGSHCNHPAVDPVTQSCANGTSQAPHGGTQPNWKPAPRPGACCRALPLWQLLLVSWLSLQQGAHQCNLQVAQGGAQARGNRDQPAWWGNR